MVAKTVVAPMQRNQSKEVDWGFAWLQNDPKRMEGFTRNLPFCSAPLDCGFFCGRPTA